MNHPAPKTSGKQEPAPYFGCTTPGCLAGSEVVELLGSDPVALEPGDRVKRNSRSCPPWGSQQGPRLRQVSPEILVSACNKTSNVMSSTPVRVLRFHTKVEGRNQSKGRAHYSHRPQWGAPSSMAPPPVATSKLTGKIIVVS